MAERVILVPDRVIYTERGESLRDLAVVVEGERIEGRFDPLQTLLAGRAFPGILRRVRSRGELRERVRLPDVLPQLLEDDVDLLEQSFVAPAVAALGFEASTCLLPFVLHERRRVGRHGGGA